jgi:DNA-binding CsgD family transcriptional regulator
MEDPTARRRLDREAMIEREEEVWQRRQRGESFRQVGRAMSMAVSSVQRRLASAAKRGQLSPGRVGRRA